MIAPEIMGAVLKPAVEFLFGEFKRILTERRERHQQRGEQDTAVALPSGVRESTREEVLTLTPANWNTEMEREVRHLLNLIEIQREHRRHAETKINRLGGLDFVPPNVRSELENAEGAIVEYTQRLKQLLERVYGQSIHIDGLEQTRE